MPVPEPRRRLYSLVLFMGKLKLMMNLDFQAHKYLLVFTLEILGDKLFLQM